MRQKGFLSIFFIVFLLIVAGCEQADNDAFDIMITFDTPLENVSFYNQDARGYSSEYDDGVYKIHDVTLGDVIIPIHDDAIFEPAQLVVESGLSTFTFTVILEDEKDDEQNDEQDDEQDDTINDPVPKTVEVDSEASFEAALDDPSVTTIVLDVDLYNSVLIERPIAIDFNDRTLFNDVTIDTEDEGRIEFISFGTIDGNVIVNAPNASFENGVAVFGSITLEALRSNSFTDTAFGNSIIVNATDVSIDLYNVTRQVTINTDDVSVTLHDNAYLEQLTITTSANNTVVNNSYLIETAVIYNETTVFDAVPEAIKGDYLPIIDGTPLNRITDIESLDTLTFDGDVALETIIEALPSMVQVSADQTNYDIRVEWLVDALAYDPSDTDAQSFTVEGLLKDLPEGLFNLDNYVAEIDISIEAQALTYVIESTILFERTIELSRYDVNTDEEIIEALPTRILALYDGSTASRNIDVIWTNTSEALSDDRTVDQTLTFTAEFINLPDDLINPNDVTDQITVIIEGTGENPPSGIVDIRFTHEDAGTINFLDDIEVNTRIAFRVEVDTEFIFVHIEDYYTGDVVSDNLTMSQFVTEDEPMHVVVVVYPVTRPDINTLYASGEGTEDNPFLITNETELSNMRYYLDYGYYFKLGNDIVLDASEGFDPLFAENMLPFNGVFDGDDYTIYNYTVHVPEDEHHSDLFGNAPVEFIVENAGTIKNVSFMNVDIPNTVSGFTGFNGGLVRYNLDAGVIRNVTIEGVKHGLGAMVAATNRGLIIDVELDIITYAATAAIADRNHGTIKDSTVTAEFNYTSIAALIHKGGVVASNNSFHDPDRNIDYNALIDNVQATITVNVDVNPPSSDTYSTAFDFGGFVGRNAGGVVQNSSVNLTFETLNFPVSQVGGFAAQNAGTIRNSSASGSIDAGQLIGGFVYRNGAGATIENAHTSVDVYAEFGRSGAFAKENASSWNITFGEIINSTSSGDITSPETSISRFIRIQDGNVDESSKGTGERIVISD